MNKIFFFTFFFFFSTIVGAQKKIIIPLKNMQKRTFAVESGSGNSFRIYSSLSEIEIIGQESKKDNFVSLSAEGLIKTYRKGLPQLPVTSKLIQVPIGAEVIVKVVSYDEELIDLKKYKITKKIKPAQVSIRKTKKETVFYNDEETYKNNEFLGKKIASFSSSGIMRDIEIGRIEINPFTYNPAKNILKVRNNIVIEVSFRESVKKMNPKSTESANFKRLAESVTINSIQNSAKALITDSPITYAIVADRMFEAQLQEFIAWKQKKGFNVITAYTDEIGSTTGQIKTYLQNLYENPPEDYSSPDFALLVGDVEQIPAWEGDFSDPHVTDLRYFEYTGDNLPEVFYGRFSAQTTAQLQAQIDKTLLYEKYQMADPSYLGRSVLVSGVDSDFAPTYGNGAIHYIYENYVNSAHNLEAYTYLYNNAAESTVMASNNGSASTSIIENFNQGVSIANYTAHCSSVGWGDPSFKTNNVSYLTNNQKYGLVIGNCCQSVTFDNTECFGESLLRAANKGAVGYLGSSNYTYWDEDYYWGVGLAAISSTPTYAHSGTGVYDALFHDKANEQNQPEKWFITQGQMNFAGNLAVEASSSELKQYYWEIYHLMGDPSLVPYLRVPDEQTYTFSPSSLLIGQTTLQVSSSPYAYVALSQNEKLIATTHTDASGGGTLNFSASDLSIGLADIVITAQNKQPVTTTITVDPANKPYVSLNIWETDIEPDYGQTLSVNVNFKNLADAQSTFHATDVQAALISGDSYITLIDGSENVGDVAAGDSISIQNAFSFRLADNIPDGNKVEFEVVVTGNNNQYIWHSYFNITANAPEIEIGELSVTADDNSNGILEPGENGTIQLLVNNVGNASAEFQGDLSLALRSLNLQLLETNDLHTISPGSSELFSFSAKAAADVLPGTEEDLIFDVFSTEGNKNYSENSTATLNIGTKPVYLMNEPETVATCLGLFTDSGNDTENYQNDENYIKTFIPNSETAFVQVEFIDFDLEEEYDYLYIYKGTNDSYAQVEGSPFTAKNSPGIIKNAGALTFKFISDGGVTNPGWKAIVSCFEPAQAPECAENPVPATGTTGIFPLQLSWNADYAKEFELYMGTDKNPFSNTPIITSYPSYSFTPKSNTNYYWAVIPKNALGEPNNCEIWNFTTGNAELKISNGEFYGICEGNFYDSGGKENNYTSNENYLMTLYPFGENSKLKLNFSEFSVEAKSTSDCWDYLRIYDGTSSEAPLLGEFCGESVPKEITEITATNASGALTFEFYSDGSEIRSGWNAKISCLSDITGIDSDFEKTFKIHPNPSSGNITLDFSSETAFGRNEVKIFNLSGNLIYSENFSGNKKTISLGNLSAGIYYLKFSSGKEIFTEKLIITK